MCGKDNYTYRQILCQAFCLSTVHSKRYVSPSPLHTALCNSLLNNFIIQQESRTLFENIVSNVLNGFRSEDRKIFLQSLWNICEYNWPSCRLLETVIEENPLFFEDIVFSIVEDLVNEKHDVEQLWLKPDYIKLITVSAQSQKLFLYTVNILSKITLYFVLNSKQCSTLISIMKGYLICVKNMCNVMNLDFVLLFPGDLQALLSLLEIDPELYTCIPLPTIKKLLRDNLNSHSLSCLAVFVYFREWLFHLYNTRSSDDF